MAVLVQEMVAADWSGVLFTADPLTGATDRVVVEYVRGLGDTLVQCLVQPERMVIEKRTGRVPALASDFERLFALACETERLFGTPQDIEWARPITGAPPTRTWEARQVWSNLNAGEVMPDVATPITWSLLQQLLDPVLGSVFRLIGADLSGGLGVGRVAGRVYFNVNTVLAAIKPFSFLLNRAPELALALGGGQIADTRQLLQSIPDEDLPDLGFRWPKYVLSWPRILRELIRHSPRRGDAWVAHLKTRLDELVRVDVEAMSTPELVRFFTQLVQDGFDGWDLLYLGTQAAALPIFEMTCRRWLDDPELTLGYRLFSGLGGVPEAEAGLALWRLAALAHADRQTASTLAASGSWVDVLAKLQQTEPGRQFAGAWSAFMSEHGHHCRGELELFNARWSETPDYSLGLVRGYLRSIDESNPVANQQRLAEERQRIR